MKRKKSVDLLRVFGEAWSRPESQEAVKPQLLAVARDDAMTDAMLEEGWKQNAANPSGLSKAALDILTIVATFNPGGIAADKNHRLEKLLRIQRLKLEQAPSVLAYAEIADTLTRMGRYAQAATAVQQLIAKYPEAKGVRSLVSLADYHRRAGHIEATKAMLREAMKLDPADGEAQLRLVAGLRQVGQIEDAVQVCATRVKKSPKTRRMSSPWRSSSPRPITRTRRSSSWRTCSSAMPTTIRS